MVNMLYDIIIPELFIFFCVICDYMIMIVIYIRYVIVICDVILTLNSKFKIRKIKIKREIEINRIHCF